MAEFVPVQPFDIVVFGVTGDLSKLKLLPALFHRFCDGQVDGSSCIIGISRTDMDHDAFVAFVHEACQAASTDEMMQQHWSSFAQLLSYFGMDATGDDVMWQDVGKCFGDAKRPRVFYLAVAPKLYVPICEAVDRAGLKTEDARVVLEKPIGTDVESAQRVNDGVERVFDENHIFRMDHYLGKETVQKPLGLALCQYAV